jgi:hypothetical protein
MKQTLRSLYLKRVHEKLEINALIKPIFIIQEQTIFIFESCAICGATTDIELYYPNHDLPLHIYFLCKKHNPEKYHRDYIR